MCRSGNEALAGGGVASKRRCPCSSGQKRREADRMRYRLARTAEQLENAPTVTQPDQPPEATEAPTVEAIQSQVSRTDEAWEQYQENQYSSDANVRDQALAHYEEQVRETGQMIHDRASHVHDLPEPVDHQALHAERFADDQAEHDRLAEIQKGYAEEFWELREEGEDLSPESRAAWSAAGEQMKPISARLAEGRAQMWNESKERSMARSAAYQKTLAEVNELGGSLEMHEASNSPSHRQARATLQSVADSTPTAWVNKSNASHENVPFYAYPSKGRAHYVAGAKVPLGEKDDGFVGPAFINEDPDNPPREKIAKTQTWVRDDEMRDSMGYAPFEYAWRKKGRPRNKKVTADRLTVSGDDEASRQQVARHEFSHRIEALDPRVATASHEFLRRRTTREDGTREPMTRIFDKGEKELGYRDGFVSHYVGKDYGSGPHSEVFSMGAESVWNGSHGGLAGDSPNSQADPEHRNLILGLYANAR